MKRRIGSFSRRGAGETERETGIMKGLGWMGPFSCRARGVWGKNQTKSFCSEERVDRRQRRQRSRIPRICSACPLVCSSAFAFSAISAALRESGCEDGGHAKRTIEWPKFAVLLPWSASLRFLSLRSQRLCARAVVKTEATRKGRSSGRNSRCCSQWSVSLRLPSLRSPRLCARTV